MHNIFGHVASKTKTNSGCRQPAEGQGERPGEAVRAGPVEDEQRRGGGRLLKKSGAEEQSELSLGELAIDRHC